MPGETLASMRSTQHVSCITALTSPAITLLTDFGTADGYVGEIKGVLLTSAPSVPIIDITHDVPPHDVEFARLTLARYWRRFPVGTVHLCVVDPGVGSDRAAIAVSSGGQWFVGPDNGLLSPALFALDARVVALPVPATAAATFHGRDVFAPAAAHLAMGASIDDLGEPMGDPVRRRTPSPHRRTDGAIVGEVLTIDRFGNAITNLIARAGASVQAGSKAFPICRTYADASSGEPLALVGSTGLIEIAVRDGNAARLLDHSRGTQVVLT
jgi:S-adenosylmethionine hydrolase